MRQRWPYLAVGCLLTVVGTFLGMSWYESAAAGARAKANPGAAQPTDVPMFGGSPTRNMVNTTDKNVPTMWDVGDTDPKNPRKPVNIKWVAELGNRSYGGPTIADGKIFVGTNNTKPRDKKIKGNRAVLMAFNQADGKFLWQLVHEIPEEVTSKEAQTEGLCSTPIVEGKHLYYVTSGGVVICATTEGKITWSYDMPKKLKVVPYHLCNCSPLIVGDLLMVVTSNGVDEEGKIHSPKAPSFIAVNKKTGALVWQSSLPGDDIIEGQFSNPALATVNGKTQVIFPGGDCVVYSFEPETGKLIWKCDCNPTRPKKKGEREFDNYIMSTPVVVGDRLYMGLGYAPGGAHTTRFSYFVCLDITKKGDVSPKNYDAKSPINKHSALVWAFGGPIQPSPAKGRNVYFGSTISTAAVHDGLVYISEERGYLHCLDAKTGQRLWDHDFKSGVWGSPYYVDGKIYIGTQDGEVVIFEHGRKAKILATIDMGETIESTPVVAGGVLYITTRSKLFAIANGK